MGASQRRKGASGEREACALLAKLVLDRTGERIKVERNLEQVRNGGTDIVLPDMMVEVKRRKKVAVVYQWLDQCREATVEFWKRTKRKSVHIPVVLLRADNDKWLVVMEAEAWFNMLDEDLVTRIVEAHRGTSDDVAPEGGGSLPDGTEEGPAA